MKGIFSGCLLVSDIDGTLYLNGKIPKRNLEAIDFFKSEGGIFSIATGRGPSVAQKICEEVRVSFPVLLSNGSVVYNPAEKRILKAQYLSDNGKSIMRKTLQKFPGIGAEITLNNSIITLSDNLDTVIHRKNENIPFLPVSFEEAQKLDWIKGLIMTTDAELLQQVKDYMNSIKTPDCNYIVTSPTYYELHVAGVNKSVNLQYLADLAGVTRNNIYCIGDYYNDAEMVKGAAIGAFCEESPHELKKTADFVAGKAQNGAVADFIYYLSEIRKDRKEE